MTQRIRVAHVIVQPVLVMDDGENLAPGPQIAPRPIAISALSSLTTEINSYVEHLNDELSS